MRTARIARRVSLAMTIAIALGVPSGSANEPAILVEAASLVPGPAGDAALYLVINNTSPTQITLTSVSSPSADNAVLVRSSGEPLARGAIVPPHAELYMQPNTIHIALSGVLGPLVPGTPFPVILTLDRGMTAEIAARVLSSEAELPDHHDYQH